jgi:hypothetical protein
MDRMNTAVERAVSATRPTVGAPNGLVSAPVRLQNVSTTVEECRSNAGTGAERRIAASY